MLIHAVPRPVRDLRDDGAQAGVLDLVSPTAARADDMVVVGRLAADIGVLPGRQVQPLDGAEILEDLQGSKDRRPADAEPSHSRCLDEAGGREVALLVCDQCSQRPSRFRQTVAGLVERDDDRGGSHR